MVLYGRGTGRRSIIDHTNVKINSQPGRSLDFYKRPFYNKTRSAAAGRKRSPLAADLRNAVP